MEYARTIGIQNHVTMTENFIMRFKLKKEQMPIIYNSFDVLLEPSIYEGFGLPPFEAQSCGIPAIVTDFTALRDAVIDGETGWKIDVAYKRFTPVGSFCGVPSVKSIYDCLMKARSTNLIKMGKKSRKYIVENYSTEKIFKENWVPFLQKLEDEIYGKEK
jgi:glycosyltransferase involved in cell wall biosynthesis